MKNLSTLVIIGVIGFVAYSYFSQADRDDSGQIVSEGQLDAFSLRVGDCTNDPESANDDGESYVVTYVTAIPCAEPHDNEFYHSFNLSHASFPGDDPIYEEAMTGCIDNFKGFVGVEYDSSILDVTTYYPTAESWIEGDREVLCGVFHTEYKKLHGSAKGIAI